mgnify:CR=1 FL=1
MINRIKSSFTLPLKESAGLNNYSKLDADDNKFLNGIANYMYSQFSEDGEEDFRKVISNAKKNSYLFDLLRDESKKRLKNQNEVFCLIDVDNYDEEIGPHMLRRICVYPEKTMLGSLDSDLIVDHAKRKKMESCIVGSFDIENNDVILYIPCVADWLNAYSKKNKISPTLESIKSSIEDFKWKKEVVINHNPEVVGEIVYAK